jgi:hypothetical protein
LGAAHEWHDARTMLSPHTHMQVTLIESERLPPQSICLKQLAHKPFVAAAPLGDAPYKVVAQVAGVLDEKASPPIVTLTNSTTGEEIVAQLCSLMVPFTPSSIQPKKVSHDSSHWTAIKRSRAQIPSAWGSLNANNSKADAANCQVGQGLEVRKGAAVGAQGIAVGEKGGRPFTSAWVGQEHRGHVHGCTQHDGIDESDAAPVCSTASLFLLCSA